MKTYAVRTRCSQRMWVDITEKAHTTGPHFMAEYRAQALAEEVGAVVEEYEIISAGRLTAADALDGLIAELVEDPYDRIIYPSFIAITFTVYECHFCGGTNRTPSKIEHAHDCLFERSCSALREYREAK